MASVGSAVRTAITSANISGITTSVYRDYAPDDASLPFITFKSDMSRTPELQGDGVVMARLQELQVDLWQSLQNENVTTVESLLAALDGATLTGADKTIFRCRVNDIQRLTEPEEDICHHALTVDVVHSN